MLHRVLLILIAILAVLCFNSLAQENLDYISFGQSTSEASHALEAVKAETSIGGLEQPCRQILPGGSLTFELKCDPDKQNYLTVKFWGSDKGKGMVFLLLDSITPGYQSDWPELDYMSEEPTFPGKFYYSTYMIPKSMTQGRNKVKLTLVSTGQATPYSSGSKVAVQDNPSRGIYAAYIHTDPFFSPE